ncbi:hypothetical protein [Pediococcus pentosaceus]|uniref:hypothetical protein n=1 Tax=Pediococcus pentosaceus TaxID=1255 RepID=UPI002072B9B1|nr:hypothetical protein [Pediococcus pentosaceus]MCM6820783.1 hypothetical protein [Pediococcus pentosaceus]
MNTGDDIYAVQTDQDGNESDQAHATVKAREVASPTIKTQSKATGPSVVKERRAIQ